MNDVMIKPTPNADSRSSEGSLNERMIFLDTEAHIEGVQKVLKEIADQLINIGEIHDHSKLTNMHEFSQALIDHAEEGKDIKETAWWKKHRQERHHLNDRVPEDVNLLDVIEMIADGVCAGMARTGDVYPIELSNDILQKAVKNTQLLLTQHVKVEE